MIKHLDVCFLHEQCYSCEAIYIFYAFIFVEIKQTRSYIVISEL